MAPMLQTLALALALVTAQAPPPPGAADAQPASPRAAVPPSPLAAPAEAPPSTAADAPGSPAAQPASAAPAPPRTAPVSAPSLVGSPPPPGSGAVAVPISQAVVEKMGQGDRHFLERDYRAALFAYQDAVYMAPDHAPARVRLGRAYLALRYPERAVEQAEKALALDPASAEARRLQEEARTPAPRPAPPGAPTGGAPGGAIAEPPPSAPHAQPRVYRFTPEPAPRSQDPAPPEQAAQPPAAPQPVAAAQQESPGGAPASAPAPSAADRYRAAVALLAEREFEKANGELTEAISADPRLAVAYAARASARFGLGRYREAADDYAAALGLDPNLGTPLFGLAECYRVLGEPARASEMYRLYAESRAPDVREDLRAIAEKRAKELQ